MFSVLLSLILASLSAVLEPVTDSYDGYTWPLLILQHTHCVAIIHSFVQSVYMLQCCVGERWCFILGILNLSILMLLDFILIFVWISHIILVCIVKKHWFSWLMPQTIKDCSFVICNFFSDLSNISFGLSKNFCNISNFLLMATKFLKNFLVQIFLDLPINI